MPEMGRERAFHEIRRVAEDVLQALHREGPTGVHRHLTPAVAATAPSLVRWLTLISPDQVKVRGVAFDGIVAALRPHYARNHDLVPESLQHHLQNLIEPDGWYPFSDYVTLMRVLATTIDPVKAKGDAYRAFGVIAARRDVDGELPDVPREQRPANIGSLQGAFKGVTGLASLVRRALHLRERYYSRGYYTIKRRSERVLEVTLQEFPASAELCAVSTGYLTQALRSANIGVWVERMSCRGNGDPDCRWELRFSEATDVGDLAVYR
jgi:hypothetical protein